MAMFIRAKRVSDPLDEKVKARLRGDGHSWSSGSEHDAADPSGLSGLVHAFLETDCTAPSSATLAAYDDANHHGGLDEDGGDNPYTRAMEIVSDLLAKTRGDRIHSEAYTAAEALAGLRSCGSGYRRGVMGRLREAGYNAGICKAKWETSGGLIAGNYEYIDIVVEAATTERYIMDPDFAAQFEVARSTAEYSRVLAALPRVMVGRAEEVRKAVRAVSDAGKRSLRSQGLTVPPWRKSRYMLAKWFGPYRRTFNEVPSSSAGAPAVGKDMVSCRAVGFHVVAVPPTFWAEPGLGLGDGQWINTQRATTRW